MTIADDPVAELRARLAGSGHELFGRLSAAAHDAVAPAGWRLRPVGAPDRLAVVIACTRAAWAPFGAWLAERGGPVAHPFDTWSAELVEAAVRDDPRVLALRWPHGRGPDGASFHALAAFELSGLASVGPARLAAHPVHGPWFGARALIVYDLPPPAAPQGAALPCPGCPAPCADALGAVLAEVARPAQVPDRPGVVARWRAWLRVRDACPVGREQRYGDDQIAYHYTGAPEHLPRG